MEQEVTETLRYFGVSTSIKGYKYIREAIMQAFYDDEMLESVTKCLYPTVAKTFDTTPFRVERAIRHAIENVFIKGNIDALNETFKHVIDRNKGKLTNSDFISLLVDDLQLKAKHGYFKNKNKEEMPAEKISFCGSVK